jgi:predicted TIM-barrel fold metal-dependent hydrolase
MAVGKRGAPPHYYVDDVWLALRTEEVLDAALPIVDPHHHLWHRPHSKYLLTELLADLETGHHVRGTVFVQCSSMYSADGDPRFACLGEVEFVNGVGAMSASGVYGAVRACAGIVGKVDLTEGASAREVLEACMERAPERFKGIRHMAAWDASPEVSSLLNPPPKDMLLDRKFREGFAQLGKLGLSFDAWVYHPQLPQLLNLVDAHPEVQVVLNHLGGRAGLGGQHQSAGEASERHDQARRHRHAARRLRFFRPLPAADVPGTRGRLEPVRAGVHRGIRHQPRDVRKQFSRGQILLHVPGAVERVQTHGVRIFRKREGRPVRRQRYPRLPAA